MRVLDLCAEVSLSVWAFAAKSEGWKAVNDTVFRRRSAMEWKYGYAAFDGKGLDPNSEMNDVQPGGLQHFLDEAGEKGWEMCGVLPSPNARMADETLTIIFKRVRPTLGTMPTETSSEL